MICKRKKASGIFTYEDDITISGKEMVRSTGQAAYCVWAKILKIKDFFSFYCSIIKKVHIIWQIIQTTQRYIK